MEMLGLASAVLVRSESVLLLRLGPMHLVEAAAQRRTAVVLSGIARILAERTDLHDSRDISTLALQCTDVKLFGSLTGVRRQWRVGRDCSHQGLELGMYNVDLGGQGSGRILSWRRR